jgi:hypothetical protein
MESDSEKRLQNGRIFTYAKADISAAWHASPACLS